MGCIAWMARLMYIAGVLHIRYIKNPIWTRREFYRVPAEELIDDNIRRRRVEREGPKMIRKIWDPHHMTTMNLIPELRAMRCKKRYNNEFRKRERCRMRYKGRPTAIRSGLRLITTGEIFYFCDPRVGRNCFRMHFEQESIRKKKKVSSITIYLTFSTL